MLISFGKNSLKGLISNDSTRIDVESIVPLKATD
jgi:hypothetical protein